MAYPDQEQSIEELLNVHAYVWNYMYKFIDSMSLKCAIELGIPDIIKNHGKPITLSELKDALPINKAKSHCVYRLMRILVHSKFFVKVNITQDNEEEEGYWLTPYSNILLKDSPFCVTPPLLLIIDPIFTTPFNDLSEWLANDHSTAFETTHGMMLWDQAVQVPRLNNLFNEAMASDARLMSHVILKDHKKLFEGLESLVDVGGGTGTMAKAIADAFPEMNCIVLDLPHVVDGLEGTENLTFAAGDMFENIPTADAVLLKWILHDWNDEDCVKILKKCKAAIPCNDRGKVIIIDIVLENRREEKTTITEDKLLFDIAMMVYHNAKERSEKEWEKLFYDSGFSNYNITPGLGVRSLIEVYF